MTSNTDILNNPDLRVLKRVPEHFEKRASSSSRTAAIIDLETMGLDSTKDQIMMRILKHWEHESKTNNTADAYGLACMGLAVCGGHLKLTQVQKEMADAINGDLPT